jgi:hypothetical protein
MVLKVEVLSRADTNSGRRSAIIRDTTERVESWRRLPALVKKSGCEGQ